MTEEYDPNDYYDEDEDEDEQPLCECGLFATVERKGTWYCLCCIRALEMSTMADILWMKGEPIAIRPKIQAIVCEVGLTNKNKEFVASSKSEEGCEYLFANLTKGAVLREEVDTRAMLFHLNFYREEGGTFPAFVVARSNHRKPHIFAVDWRSLCRTLEIEGLATLENNPHLPSDQVSQT